MEKRALETEERELIEIARGAIAPCYDGEEYRHTVGCALRPADGKIYRGVNVYSIHGTCAEPVAIVAAVMDGARSEIMPPDTRRLHARLLGDHRRRRRALQDSHERAHAVSLPSRILRAPL